MTNEANEMQKQMEQWQSVLKGKRVLVVYAGGAQSGKVRVALDKAGCKVESRDGVKDALELLASGQRFDCVLCDVGFEIDNCFELVSGAGKLKTEAPPIVVVCDQADPRFDDAFYEGADAIFVRPISDVDLLTGIAYSYLGQVITSKRKHLRRKMPRALISYKGMLANGKGFAVNISRGGMFVGSMGELPAEGTEVTFEIYWEKSEVQLTGTAIVRWHRGQIVHGRPRGFGVEFSPATQRILDGLSIFR